MDVATRAALELLGMGAVEEGRLIRLDTSSAGAILRHQVVVSCSCFQLLHRQLGSACSKSNIWLLKKQIFFPSNPVTDCTFDKASLLSLLFADSFPVYW